MKVIFLAVALQAVPATAHAQADPNADLELAVKEAVKKAAPSVVQIVTQGGADQVVMTAKGPAFRKGLGPTTGVIVSADGFIVSSAFNFINNPTNILVVIPGAEEPVVAKKIATDRSKMLTLLKIDKTGLPVPSPVPMNEIVEGQWAIALGRTLDTRRNAPPSVSLGIISAVGRIWGKAIQTDCKVSPVNYGGPIVDLQGRVQGILIPASPRGDNETAGFEWYDSGIGFAIPFADVLAVLPRLKEGKDLKKGLLGIALKTQDMYGAAPEVGQVTKKSAADRIGLKPGDIITEIDGKPVVRMAQILHLLGPKYEGDKISLKYKRGDQETVLKDVELIGTVQSVAQPFLGILPMRDDPKLGVEIRHVFPQSAAAKAGLKEGDRIVKFGTGKNLTAFSGKKSGREQFLDFLNTQTAGEEITLEVTRTDGKSQTITVVTEALAQEIPVPDKLPVKASKEKALEPLETTDKNVKPPKIDPNARKAETGMLKRTTATGEHKYWIYVHDDYDPNISHALVVWLHPLGKNRDEDGELIADMWADYCKENRIILVGPTTDNDSGWIPGQADFIVEAIRDVMNRYTIDRQRVVAHGLGIGGNMAQYLGFNNRDLIRGVAALGAVPTNIQESVASQRLAFYLAAGQLDPLSKNIAESKATLLAKKYPVVFREIPNRGREYFSDAQLRELVMWIESLDKQ